MWLFFWPKLAWVCEVPGICPLHPISKLNVEQSERPAPPCFCVEQAWAGGKFEWTFLTFTLSSCISRGKFFSFSYGYSVQPKKLPCDVGVQPRLVPETLRAAPMPLWGLPALTRACPFKGGEGSELGSGEFLLLFKFAFPICWRESSDKAFWCGEGTKFLLSSRLFWLV